MTPFTNQMVRSYLALILAALAGAGCSLSTRDRDASVQSGGTRVGAPIHTAALIYMPGLRGDVVAPVAQAALAIAPHQPAPPASVSMKICAPSLRLDRGVSEGLGNDVVHVDFPAPKLTEIRLGQPALVGTFDVNLIAGRSFTNGVLSLQDGCAQPEGSAYAVSLTNSHGTLNLSANQSPYGRVPFLPTGLAGGAPPPREFRMMFDGNLRVDPAEESTSSVLFSSPPPPSGPVAVVNAVDEAPEIILAQNPDEGGIASGVTIVQIGGLNGSQSASTALPSGVWQALQQANPEYPTTLEYLVLLDGTEQTAGLPAVTTVEELH
ncbi:MAG: hypothetical protein AB7P04_11335, partial [Bacteriovoracia bacterium]